MTRRGFIISTDRVKFLLDLSVVAMGIMPITALSHRIFDVRFPGIFLRRYPSLGCTI